MRASTRDPKGVPIAGDVLVCDLWTLGIEDRCPCTGQIVTPPHPLLDKRTHRSEYIDITVHTDQLSSIGCQHGRHQFPLSRMSIRLR